MKVSCFLSVCVALACAARTQPEPARGVARVTVLVDPRIELLSVVEDLADYRWSGLLTKYESSYRAALREYFAPYRSHEAVTLFSRMCRRRFNADAPVGAVLHLGDPPELEPRFPIAPHIIDRAGSAEELERFFAAMRDFARRSSFAGFFADHGGFYEAMVEPVAAAAKAIDVDALEEYTGVRQHSYRLILAPMLHSGGFGPCVAHDDGRFDVYSVCGPRGVNDDIPVFDSARGLRFLVIHEFGHSFINPLVERFRADIDRHRRLYWPMRAEMSRQGYGDWQTCACEHLDRAVQCRIYGVTGGEKEGRELIAHAKARGFAHVEALCDRLKEYERQRDRYPTLADFFPRLIEVFEEAAAALPEPDLTPPRVVSSVPPTGAVDVDPALRELRVEYSHDMHPHYFSWGTRGDFAAPAITGQCRWETPRVCVLPVKLEPGKTYWLGLNYGGMRVFRSEEEVYAEAFVLQFTTAGDAEPDDGG